MRDFFRLVSIENKKLWKRLAAKVMLIILLVIIIAPISIYKYYTSVHHISSTTAVSQNWKSDMQNQLTAEKAALKELENGGNKLAQASRGPMEKTIAELQYKIDNDIKPESQSSIWNMITEFDAVAGHGQLIALFLIIACAAVVAGEFSEGTMKMMICRPYSRIEILTAKLIAVLIYGLILLAVTFAANFLLFGILFGFNGMGQKDLFWTGSSIIYMPTALKTISIFGLDFLQVLAYVILAFTISAVFRSRSLATGFSLFLLLMVSGIMRILTLYFGWFKYLPFGNTDFSAIVNNGAYAPGITLFSAIAISIVYSVIICFIGYFVFSRRDI